MANLIIICGLPGTGKTTLAKKIAAKIGGVLLRTDVVRKELATQKYTKKERQGVYKEMFNRAKKLLKKDQNVILEATFAERKYRQEAKKIARNLKAGLKIVEVVCPQSLVKERMVKRTGDESQAEFKHYLMYKKFFEPIKEKHIVIDTSQDIDKQLQTIFD